MIARQRRVAYIKTGSDRAAEGFGDPNAMIGDGPMTRITQKLSSTWARRAAHSSCVIPRPTDMLRSARRRVSGRWSAEWRERGGRRTPP